MVFVQFGIIKSMEYYKYGCWFGISVFFNIDGIVNWELWYVQLRVYIVSDLGNSIYFVNGFLNGFFVQYYYEIGEKIVEGMYWMGYWMGVWIEYEKGGGYWKLYYFIGQ